ncbi:hypothetical protein [Treponema sp.]|uniref:hypothetical protein n=1 Tax=Treponema sp. TaxID=166 RepID=UPI0025FCEBDC|nr:hypothetical protein [Treponema sp.]MCR5218311.1 hypothetical protein [Treponema sp.]
MDNRGVNIQELTSVLINLDKVLDQILVKQDQIHECVKNRSWTELESCLETVRILSDAFVELDAKREMLVSSDSSVYSHNSVAPVFARIRSKLMKSKIENEALNKYVQSAQKFVYGVIERCVPQQRTTVYTRNGNLRKAAAPSLVVNAVF